MKSDNTQFLVPEIVTDRTLIRAPQVSDLEESEAMWSAFESSGYFGSRAAYTKSETWHRLLRYLGHWQTMRFGYWIVQDKNSGEYLGEVGFAENYRDIKPSIVSIPEIGWAFAPHARGRGLATEAVVAIVQWADKNIKCEKTTAIVDISNAASISVARKAGYIFKLKTTMGGENVWLMERVQP